MRTALYNAGVTPRLSAVLSLLLVMLIWGSTFAVTKSALSEAPPLVLALLRFLVASGALMALTGMRHGSRTVGARTPWGPLALMGLTGVALYFACFNLSLRYTTATEAALIQSSIPAVTLVMSAAFLRERLSPGRALGVVLSMLGVVWIALAGSQPEGAPNRLLGDALMFGAVVVWSGYTILGKRLEGLPQLPVTAYSTFLGTAMLVPLALLELRQAPPIRLTATGWASVAYLGLIASALCFGLWNRALRHLDASQVSNFINLVPLVGVATATVFLGERPSPAQLFGGLVVLVGVWLSSRSP